MTTIDRAQRLVLHTDKGERDSGDVWGIAIWRDADKPVMFSIQYEGARADWWVTHIVGILPSASIVAKGTMEADRARQLVAECDSLAAREFAVAYLQESGL